MYCKSLFWQPTLILLFWACSTDRGQSLPTALLQVGSQAIEAELALNPEEQAKGLMYRESMDEMHGMLFSFTGDRILRFYMKNTLIPLSIAYLNKDGVISEIYDMQPLNENIVMSQWPMHFALEMNLGWFERNDVRVGQRVTVLGGNTLQHGELQKLAER